jgi:hypothetical protein
MALFEWEGMSYTQAGVDAMFSEEEKRATGVNPNADVAKLLRTANWPADKAFATRDDAMCHGGPDSGYRPANPVGSFAEIASKKIAVVGLSMQTPATLFNSVMSWDRSGLLDLAHERMLLLNSPHPAELAVGYDYGFRVVQPRDIPGVKMNPSRDNVVTIGAAFYYSLTLVESDYIIFLEKDFMADYTLGKEGFARQIAAAIQVRGGERGRARAGEGAREGERGRAREGERGRARGGRARGSEGGRGRAREGEGERGRARDPPPTPHPLFPLAPRCSRKARGS